MSSRNFNLRELRLPSPAVVAVRYFLFMVLVILALAKIQPWLPYFGIVSLTMPALMLFWREEYEQKVLSAHYFIAFLTGMVSILIYWGMATGEYPEIKDVQSFHNPEFVVVFWLTSIIVSFVHFVFEAIVTNAQTSEEFAQKFAKIFISALISLTLIFALLVLIGG